MEQRRAVMSLRSVALSYMSHFAKNALIADKNVVGVGVQPVLIFHAKLLIDTIDKTNL